MSRLSASIAGLVAMLAAAAPAAAATPTTPVTVPTVTTPVTTPTTPTTPATTPKPVTKPKHKAKPKPKPKPKPKAKAVSGTIKIVPQEVGGAQATVVAGTHWRVQGTLKPYVSHQTVTVRFYLGGRRLGSKTAHVTPSKGHTGTFLIGFKTQQVGLITVRASHRGTSKLKTILARSKSVTVLDTHAEPGNRGATVRAMQHKLEALHLAVQPTGLYDERTGRAVLAFQKLTGLPRSSVADAQTMRKLFAGAGHFKVRFPGDGKHVEADLAMQVIALIGAHGQVQHVYPVSSGKPSTPTILGRFHVYEKAPGYNSEGMYFSSYFIRGYAIHGYDPSPNYAASHGCLRTWIPDAISIYNWLSVGDGVDVYLG